MNLKEQIYQLKLSIESVNPESLITYTLTAENTGELMDTCFDDGQVLIKPFSDSAQQDCYYFEIPVKKNVIIKIKSSPKKYRL